MSKKKRSNSSSSTSGSDSSSDSDSSSGSSSDSDSGSDSSSDDSSSSDSDSDGSSTPSSSSPKKSKKAISKPKALATKPSKQSSDSGNSATSSSATLVGDNPPKTKKETDTLLVADENSKIGTKMLPATKENVKQLKKEQVPFSRIPTDTKIDPKFSSNKYVSYDYADRAYNDLSITKGKGFTKEKNKKKRGTSNTTARPTKPAWKRRLEAEYAGLLDDPEPDFTESDGFVDYNPLGFKSDTFDFMSGCGFNPMTGGF